MQCSSHVTVKANPGEVVRNSHEWLRARKQRRNVEKKKFLRSFNRVIISAYEAVGVQSLKISHKSTRMTFIFAILGPNNRVKLGDGAAQLHKFRPRSHSSCRARPTRFARPFPSPFSAP